MFSSKQKEQLYLLYLFGLQRLKHCRMDIDELLGLTLETLIVILEFLTNKLFRVIENPQPSSKLMLGVCRRTVHKTQSSSSIFDYGSCLCSVPSLFDYNSKIDLFSRSVRRTIDYRFYFYSLYISLLTCNTKETNFKC